MKTSKFRKGDRVRYSQKGLRLRLLADTENRLGVVTSNPRYSESVNVRWGDLKTVYRYHASLIEKVSV